MDTKNIIDNAVNLSTAEGLIIIETLSKNLSEPNADIEKYWKKEVDQRYATYLDSRVKSILYEEVTKK